MLAHRDRQLPTFVHRLTCVDDEVQQDLLDLAGVDRREDVRLESSFESDSVFLQIFFDKQQQVGHQLAQVNRFVAVAAVASIGEHSGGDLGGTLSGRENLAEGLFPGLLVGVPQSHLRVVDHRGQDVVELVRRRRGDRADRAHLLGLTELFLKVFEALLEGRG